MFCLDFSLAFFIIASQEDFNFHMNYESSVTVADLMFVFLVIRVWMDVLFCNSHPSRHQHRSGNRSYFAWRRVPSGMKAPSLIYTSLRL